MSEAVNKEAIDGGCYCGKVQYQVRLPVKWCAHCHCTQCRHTQGAPIITWFGVDDKNFQIIKGENDICWFESSEQAKRGHCSHCGTPLFFLGQRWQGEVHITRESTQEDILLKPKVHVFYERHVDYLEFDDSLDKYGGADGVTKLELE